MPSTPLTISIENINNRITLNRRELMLGGLFSLFFISLCILYYDFVVDDAFIIFRYAKNIIESHQLTWNVNSTPVEGYTSTLWVAINAMAIRLHINPLIFSKIFSLGAALGIIWLLVLASQRLHWHWRLITVSALALSPVLAMLTMQGLETTFTALLLLLVAKFSIDFWSNPSHRAGIFLYAAMLLSFLTRPDTAIFGGGIFITIITMSLWQKKYNTVRLLVTGSIPFVLLGLIYMVLRLKYFGYFFPNTYYIKLQNGNSLITVESIMYVWSFFLLILWPYVALFGKLIYKFFDKKTLLLITPVLMGCLLFYSYSLLITPIQGFLWRFIFPMYPALLLVAVTYLTRISYRNPLTANRWWAYLLLAGFLLWPFLNLPQTLQEKYFRVPRDRIVIGQQLAGLSGKMFVTESGALPYYSGWTAVDWLGLNSDAIAHQGLTLDYLQSFNPDLIMIYNFSSSFVEYGELVNQFFASSEYVGVAAIHKNADQYHLYYVRRDSSLFPQIVNRLLDVPGITYADITQLTKQYKINVTNFL